MVDSLMRFMRAIQPIWFYKACTLMKVVLNKGANWGVTWNRSSRIWEEYLRRLSAKKRHRVNLMPKSNKATWEGPLIGRKYLFNNFFSPQMIALVKMPFFKKSIYLIWGNQTVCKINYFCSEKCIIKSLLSLLCLGPELYRSLLPAQRASYFGAYSVVINGRDYRSA